MFNDSISLCHVLTIFNNPKITLNSAYLPPSKNQIFQVEENMKRDKKKWSIRNIKCNVIKSYHLGLLKLEFS